MDSLLTECRWLATGLLVLSAAGVFLHIRAGTLLSSRGGLHANMLLFFGLGACAYVAPGIVVPDRRSIDQLLEAFLRGGPFLLAGYAIVVGMDWRSLRWRTTVQVPGPTEQSSEVGLWVLALGLVGGWGLSFTFSTSSLGTIFPVLQMLTYPGVALGIVAVSWRRPLKMLVFAILLAVEAYLVLFTPWRSGIIMLTASIGLGYFWRTRGSHGQKTRALGLVSAAFFALMILLPFLQEKKLNYEEVAAAPLEALSRTLSVSAVERVSSLGDFWAERINGSRELAHVEDALDSGQIQLRYGLTYVEALQQLIPRILWPDKPSFNLTTNYEFARQVGLVGWEDPFTSWGVSLYAEAVWNFGAASLVWFVPIAFFFAGMLDRFVAHSLENHVFRQVVHVGMFFRFLDVPGVVGVMTLVLWLMIIGKGLALLLTSAQGSGRHQRSIGSERDLRARARTPYRRRA